MHIIWWNLSSFWQLGSAQIIGVQFNRQNLNYFGLSATPFSLDTVSPGWRSDKCPQVEEYAFVYASREDLEIFGSSEIGLLSRVCGLGCALPCDPVSSIWAGMQRNVYRKTPGERQESLPPAASTGAGPCISECLGQCSLASVGELHMGPTLVIRIWVSAVSTSWCISRTRLWTEWCHPDSLSPTSQPSLVSLLATVPA